MFFHLFSNYCLALKLFWRKNFGSKAACKMLVKLTTVYTWIKLKLSCDSRFQRAFTACVFVFEVITLVWTNQGNFFENATACSNRMRKTLVATQLKLRESTKCKSIFNPREKPLFSLACLWLTLMYVEQEKGNEWVWRHLIAKWVTVPYFPNLYAYTMSPLTGQSR